MYISMQRKRSGMGFHQSLYCTRIMVRALVSLYPVVRPRVNINLKFIIKIEKVTVHVIIIIHVWLFCYQFTYSILIYT